MLSLLLWWWFQCWYCFNLVELHCSNFQFVVIVVVAVVLILSCRCCHMVVLAVLFRHAQQEGRVLRLMALSQKSVVSLNTNCPVARQ